MRIKKSINQYLTYGDLTVEKKFFFKKRIIKLLLLFYIISIFVAVFFNPERINAYPVRMKPNYIPFKNIAFEFIFPPAYVPPGHTIGLIINIIGNLLLFIPLPILLCFLYKKNGNMQIFLFGLCCSIFIETIQGLFYIGLFDIDDIILNSISIWIGIMLFKVISKYLEVA